MEAKEIINGYCKTLKEQIDQMDEEEITRLASQVAAFGGSLKVPTDDQIRNTIAFFEHKNIPPIPLVRGIRVLAQSAMGGRLVSMALALQVASALNKIPESFWAEPKPSSGTKC